jgi:radical SAM superfamily enzyme YgiQ (UPF0313 family)
MKMFHVKHRSPHILLINPWITDFAAYNFWIKPHGLLSIASFLRNNGFKITFIDCLDSTVKRKKYGDGKFRKIEIEKPLPIKSVPRKYSQYGISEEIFRNKISHIEKPDLIGITSGMTYWYPGAFKAIKIVKESFKKVPILLGGIYATLCYDHAVRYSEADYVIRGRGELQLSKIISELLNIQLQAPGSAVYHAGMHGCPEPNVVQGELSNNIDSLPYPAFDLYSKLDYVSIMTSRGCPYRCSYCASPVISEGFERRDPLKVVEEIAFWTSHYRVNNIAFYDDALLVNPSEHIIKILKEVRKRDIQCNFHSPNGLHVKEINKKLAALLYHCQFKTLRLGLETSNEGIQVETGGKVDNRAFGEAVGNLRRAGYSEDEIGVYIMAGLPGQRVGEVEESIAFVKENGAKPILVEYSPIPETLLFEKATEMSEFDLENEPLFHNNSIFPCQWEGFTLANFQRLKKKVNA